LKALKEDRSLTNRGLARNGRLNPLKMSRCTIARIANKAGLKSRVAKRTFYLNQKNKDLRFAWAKKYRNKP